MHRPLHVLGALKFKPTEAHLHAVHCTVNFFFIWVPFRMHGRDTKVRHELSPGPTIRTGCTYLRSVSYKLVARNLSYLISGLHMQFLSRLISKISRPCARNFWKFQKIFGLASLGFVNAKKTILAVVLPVGFRTEKVQFKRLRVPTVGNDTADCLNSRRQPCGYDCFQQNPTIRTYNGHLKQITYSGHTA